MPRVLFFFRKDFKMIKSLNAMFQDRKNGKCPFCGDSVTKEQLEKYDELTKKEFEISGICTDCQDDFFKK